MVDYKLLSEMLDAALAKETKESWCQWLDDCYADSRQIDTLSTLDVNALCIDESMIADNWNQEVVAKSTNAKDVADGDNQYAMAA